MGLIFACGALLLVTTCHKSPESSPVITIEHEIKPQPVRVGTATITLRLADASRRAVKGAQIILEGNMSHAGMGPAFGKAREIAPGQYQAPLELSMVGDWIVLIHLTLSDGQKVERQFEIRGVQSD